MPAAEQKIVQYLNEAHASEVALLGVLQAQIAMTPRGTLRSGLETHLSETQDHADRLETRLGELEQGNNPLMAVLGAAETVIGQVVALSKTPLDLLRGTGGEEKVLKNVKDACATEALEIATYTAIERMAAATGDTTTERLAKSIRADEEKMLKLLMREIPKLTDAVVGADVDGHPTYDVTKTGAADSARKVAKTTKKAARKARKVPGVAQAEGQVKGAVASQSDLAITGYDKLNADEVNAKLPDLSQIDLAKISTYERKNQNRSTVLSRVETLRGNEPWAGYDELKGSEVQTALAAGNDALAKKVRTYEQAHKGRAGVVNAAERELSKA